MICTEIFFFKWRSNKYLYLGKPHMIKKTAHKTEMKERHWLESLRNGILQRTSCCYLHSCVCWSSEGAHLSWVIVICAALRSVCPLLCHFSIPTLFWTHGPVSTKSEKSLIIRKLVHLCNFWRSGGERNVSVGA